VTVTGSPEVTLEAESSTPENPHIGLVASAVSDTEASFPDASTESAASAMEGTASTQVKMTAKTSSAFLHLAADLIGATSGVTNGQTSS
jgi:hypothetical protein